jgi:hypothetical protein
LELAAEEISTSVKMTYTYLGRCMHGDTKRILSDLTQIKKHYARQHGSKI